jgi:hypothetical protein
MNLINAGKQWVFLALLAVGTAGAGLGGRSVNTGAQAQPNRPRSQPPAPGSTAKRAGRVANLSFEFN